MNDKDEFENDGDDLDLDLDLDDTGFDEFAEKEQTDNTLLHLWHNNPLFKVGAIAVGVILFIFIIVKLSAKDEPAARSKVQKAPEIQSTPGGEGSSQAYIEALVDENTSRYEQALTQGGSSIPTPINAGDDLLSLGGEDAGDQEDPLQRWRRLQQERLANANAAAEELEELDLGPTAEELAQRRQAIEALASTMGEQMSAILDNKSEVNVDNMSLTPIQFLEDLKESQELAAQEALEQENGDEDGDEATITVVHAGEIAYAKLLIEANSDVQGPVLALLLSGPLKGEKVLGSFEVQDEYLTLNFDTVVIDGESHEIEAVALDPDTTLPGMATDVDHHYLARIVLPMASSFIEGAASAIAETGLTTITIEGDTVTSEQAESDNEQEIAAGIDEAGSELSSIIDEMTDDLETTVIIRTGTPMGLLFTSPVSLPISSTLAQKIDNKQSNPYTR